MVILESGRHRSDSSKEKDWSSYSKRKSTKQAERYARALRVHCDTKVYNATLIGCGPKVDLTINSLQAK